MKKILICNALILVFFSCASDNASTKVDYEKMADGTCECYTRSGLDSLNRLLENAIDSDSSHTNTSELLIASQNGFEVFNECVKNLEKKYGKIQDSVQAEKLEKILQKNCPEVYEIIAEENH